MNLEGFERIELLVDGEIIIVTNEDSQEIKS